MKRSYLFVLTMAMSSLLFAQKGKPIDHKATKQTKALYKNLGKLAKEHTLFGHQHATEYGHGWEGDEDRSDVKSVTGSHPAVVGIDFSAFTAGNPEYVKSYKQHVKKNR
jgi:mannan endo-1,4-beta-mannosidase